MKMIITIMNLNIYQCQVQNEYTILIDSVTIFIFVIFFLFSKARHSALLSPIYITVDPNSPAYVVYHDHSYFIRYESINSSMDDIQQRKSSLTISNNQDKIREKPTLPSVQILNQLVLERQQKATNSLSDSSTATTLDFTTILRALLSKQGHQLVSTKSQEIIDEKLNHDTSSSPSPTATSKSGF